MPGQKKAASCLIRVSRPSTKSSKCLRYLLWNDKEDAGR